MYLDLEITDVEKDLIKEIVNIGLAKAADSLAILAQERVMLSVPEVTVMDLEELRDVLSVNARNSTLIKSLIKGDLEGKTYILFGDAQSDNLAKVCFGSATDFRGNYTAMKKSLLLETSNILTGSMVTQLANILGLSLYGSIPSIVPNARRSQLDEVMQDFEVTRHFVLTIITQFVNSGKVVEMPMLIVFDLKSVEKIVGIIRNQLQLDSNWLMH